MSGDQNGESVPYAGQIADLHCHYPMHVVAGGALGSGWKETVQAEILTSAARFANHESFRSGWRVSLEGLRDGDVRLVLSVLYSPFAELDLGDLFAPDIEDSYFKAVTTQLDAVERELAFAERKLGGSGIYEVVKTGDQLKKLGGDRRIGICHAVEGGFHLGRDPEAVPDRVAELARRGVAYITLAHLFPKHVAANVPALPFLPDRLYEALFYQRHEAGLPPVGEAAVRAMHEHGVLIDLSHMREDSINATLDLLDDLDRQRGRDPRKFPVMASHAGYRLGTQHYMLSPSTIARIAKRDGVVGLIMAQHQLNDGRPHHRDDSLSRTAETVVAHADAIKEITGSDRHVAIGSDLDGFIRPTMRGVQRIQDLAALRDELARKWHDNPDRVKALLWGNALGVLEKRFR